MKPFFFLACNDTIIPKQVDVLQCCKIKMITTYKYVDVFNLIETLFVLWAPNNVKLLHYITTSFN